jgi:hypothetical protein
VPGKLSTEKLPVYIFYGTTQFIKPLLYLLIWIIKILLVSGKVRTLSTLRKRNIKRFVGTSSLTSKQLENEFIMDCKMVYWVRKICFLLMNAMFVDGVFFGSRTLLIFSNLGLRNGFSNVMETQTASQNFMLVIKLSFSALVFFALVSDLIEVLRFSWDIQNRKFFTQNLK